MPLAAQLQATASPSAPTAEPVNPAPTTGDDPQLALKKKLHGQAASALRKVFQVPGLSFAQRKLHAVKLNHQLRMLEFELGHTQLQSWPQAVELPVAGNCNLRCEMCSLAHGAPTYPFWTLQDVSRFKELFKFASSVNPTGVGEPLMAREFFPMIEFFKSHGLMVGFFTNATLMDEKKADKLIRLGVDAVNISLDGATKETFERIRVHAKFEPVLRNIRQLVALRDASGTKLPRVQIAMVLMKDNVHEFPAMVRLAKDLGADRLYGMYMSKSAAVLEPRMPQHDAARTNAFLREGRELAQSLGLDLWIPELLPEPASEAARAQPEQAVERPNQKLGNREVYCAYPWMQFLVHNDGDVSPCCQIHGPIGGQPFGNIHQTPPEQLWNSPGMVTLREKLLKGEPPGICRNCKLRTSQMT